LIQGAVVCVIAIDGFVDASIAWVARINCADAVIVAIFGVVGAQSSGWCAGISGALTAIGAIFGLVDTARFNITGVNGARIENAINVVCTVFGRVGAPQRSLFADVVGAFIVVIALVGVGTSRLRVARIGCALRAVITIDRAVVATILFIAQVECTRIAVLAHSRYPRCVGAIPRFGITEILGAIGTIIACDDNLIDTSSRCVAGIRCTGIGIVAHVRVLASRCGNTFIERTGIQIVARCQTV
jgi:hypothetical protein